MRARAGLAQVSRRWRPGSDAVAAVTCLGRRRSEPAVVVASAGAPHASRPRCACVHSRARAYVDEVPAFSRLVRYSGRGVAQPTPAGQCRALGMLASLQRALGLGDSSSTETLETHRADILAARSTQASSKLRRLLRRKREKEAWEYFAQLCNGPDINEFHCSIMLSVAASPQEVQRVVDMAGRAGVQPNAAVYV